MDQPLRTIVALVRKVAEWSSGGDDDGDKKKPPSKEEREEARKHLQKYNPQIPGKVVYTYRYAHCLLPASGPLHSFVRGPVELAVCQSPGR